MTDLVRFRCNWFNRDERAILSRFAGFAVGFLAVGFFWGRYGGNGVRGHDGVLRVTRLGQGSGRSTHGYSVEY